MVLTIMSLSISASISQVKCTEFRKGAMSNASLADLKF
jgi:hypothetical protein